jgi:hypothetical protein
MAMWRDVRCGENVVAYVKVRKETKPVTDTQLYLAIGIPSALFMLNVLAIIAAGFWQVKRFDDMGKRFDDMKDLLRSEIGGVRSDIQRVAAVVGAKIEALGERVKALKDEIHSPLVKR